MKGLASIDFLHKQSQSKYYGFINKIRHKLQSMSNSTIRTAGVYWHAYDEEKCPNHIDIFLGNINWVQSKCKHLQELKLEDMVISVITHESLHSAFRQTMPELNYDEHYTQWTQMKLGQLVLESNRLYL